MTSIQITYKHNHLEATKSLTTLVEQKFVSFEKFIKPNAVVRCAVEFEKIGTHHHGKIYRMEANLFVDGDLYRAEATEETFVKAIDVVRDELDNELRRAKDKQQTVTKDSARALKGKMLE
jgi:ribosomal subunit interface protein